MQMNIVTISMALLRFIHGTHNLRNVFSPFLLISPLLERIEGAPQSSATDTHTRTIKYSNTHFYPQLELFPNWIFFFTVQLMSPRLRHIRAEH